MPFSPTTGEENNGGLWLYKKVTFALPSSSQFKVALKFGKRQKSPPSLMDQLAHALDPEPEPGSEPEPEPIPTFESAQIRVKLLGFYTNKIEIA